MKRRSRTGTAWIAITAASVLGCRPADTCSGPRCDTLIVLATADADVLLPPLTAQSVGTEVTDLLFLKLLEIGVDLNTLDIEAYRPRLASEWRRLDSLRLEFTIDGRARWSDGTPVSAADVAFSFELYKDTLTASRFAAQLQSIDSVVAVAERSVVVHFSHPYAEQLYDATQHVRVLPRHILAGVSRDSLPWHPFSRSPVGNGPYEFVRWVPNQLIELRASADFFLGEPPITMVIWRTSIDDGSRKRMLLAGEGDVIGTLTNSDDRRDLERQPGIRVTDYASPVYFFVAFNMKASDGSRRPHPLFGDPAVRRALALAVDRETLVAAAFGEDASVALGPVTRLSWLWRPDLPQVPFDASAAGLLLDEIGWVRRPGGGTREKAGRSLSLRLIVPSSSRSRMDAAIVLQEQLRMVGVELEVVPLEFNTFLAAAQEGSFDAVFSAFLVDPSPAGMRDLWGSAGLTGNNWGSFVNATVDSLMESAIRTTDTRAAEGAWRRAIDLILEDVPAIWIAEPTVSAAMAARVETTPIRPDRWAADIWRWRISQPATAGSYSPD